MITQQIPARSWVAQQVRCLVDPIAETTDLQAAVVEKVGELGEGSPGSRPVSKSTDWTVTAEFHNLFRVSQTESMMRLDVYCAGSLGDPISRAVREDLKRRFG